MADDLSGLLTDLDPSIVQGLGDLAGMNQGGGDYATSDVQFASTGQELMIPPMKKASLGKAVRLLGAALSYYGAGALQGILPSLANVLGVQAGDLLIAFLGKKSRGRKRRGITYRQIANARRVYGTVDSLYHRLHGGGHHRRRSSGGYHTMRRHRRGKGR